MGLEAEGDLLLGVLLLRQGRQILQGEVAAFGGFAVFHKGPAQKGAKDKDFADFPGVNRLVVLFPILYRNDALRPNGEARFLQHLLDGAFRHRKAGVYPAPWEGPEAIQLPHQQNFFPLEDGRSGIQLGGLVAAFAAEEVPDLFRGDAAPLRQHLRRNVPHPLVPLQVEPVPAVVQPRLGDGLKLHRPIQPVFIPFHPPRLLYKDLPCAFGHTAPGRRTK